jgi:tetratricopeptide (TPR) repeat protein
MRAKAKKQINIMTRSKKSSFLLTFFEKNYNLLVVFILTISILLIYYKITGFNFTDFDDSVIINSYRNVFKNNGNIWSIFTFFPLSQFYRPILSLSFFIDISLSDSLTVFYISNILFHITASILIVYFLRFLGYEKITSILSGLLTAVHPLLTPAIAWIPGRNDSLITIFVILTVIAFLRIFNENVTKNTNMKIVIFLLLFLISVFTKEIAVMLPFLLLIYLVNEKKFNLKDKKQFISAIGMILIICIYLILRNTYMDKTIGRGNVGFLSMIANLPTFLALPGKFIFPYKMSGYPFFDFLSIASGIVVYAVTTLILLKNKLFNNRIKLALSWIILMLLPTLIIKVSDIHYNYLEHRAYLLFPAFLIIILEILKVMKVKVSDGKFISISICIIMIFAVKSFVYTDVYKDSLSFWSNNQSIYPESFASNLNYGKALFDREMYLEAEPFYRNASQLYTKDATAFTNLALISSKKNDLKSALNFARQAYMIDTNNIETVNNLGLYLNSAKNYLQAEYYLRRAFNLTDDIKKKGQISNDLAISFSSMNQDSTAINYLEKAKNYDNTNSQTYKNLTILYIKNNKLDKASETINESMKLHNANPELLVMLTEIYIRQNNIPAARATAEKLKGMGLNLPKEIMEKIK